MDGRSAAPGSAAAAGGQALVVVGEDALELSASLEDPRQLSHLWALFGRELWREWRLDSLVAREKRPVRNCPSVTSTSRHGARKAMRGTSSKKPLVGRPPWGGGSHSFAALTKPSADTVYQAIAAWSPVGDLLIGFRAGRTLMLDSLPSLEAAARTGRLPRGDRGFMVCEEQTSPSRVRA